MTHRVVVTGWGVLSSIGHDAATYWDNLKRGTSGIAPAVTIPTDQLTQKVVAEVKDYDPLKHFDERAALPMDRVAQFGVIAARVAGVPPRWRLRRPPVFGSLLRPLLSTLRALAGHRA